MYIQTKHEVIWGIAGCVFFNAENGATVTLLLEQSNDKNEE